MHEAEDVRIAMDERPLTSDLGRPTDFNSHLVSGLTQATLMLDGEHGPSAGAALTWSAREGGRVWRVSLDTSRRWSDGRHLRPQDALVAVSDLVERGHRFSQSVFGTDTRRAPARIVDGESVEYVFARPIAYAPALLTLSELAPARTGGPRTSASPVLGDYRIVAEASGRTTLQRHPLHPQPDLLAPRLSLLLVEGDDAGTGAFERQEVDVTAPTSFGPRELARYAHDERLRSQPLAMVGCLEFGGRSSCAWELRCARGWLASVLDRERLARATHGLVRPCWRQTQIHDPSGTTRPVDAQDRQPRRPTGVPRAVEISYADFAPNDIVVRDVCAQVADRHGIVATPRPLRFADFVRAVVTREFDLMYTLSMADFPHPAALLAPRRLKTPRTRHPVQDVELDRLVEEAEGCMDADEEPSRWRALEDRWLEYLPRIPLVQVRSHYLASPELSVELSPLGRMSVKSNEPPTTGAVP